MAPGLTPQVQRKLCSSRSQPAVQGASPPAPVGMHASRHHAHKLKHAWWPQLVWVGGCKCTACVHAPAGRQPPRPWTRMRSCQCAARRHDGRSHCMWQRRWQHERLRLCGAQFGAALSPSLIHAWPIWRVHGVLAPACWASWASWACSGRTWACVHACIHA